MIFNDISQAFLRKYKYQTISLVCIAIVITSLTIVFLPHQVSKLITHLVSNPKGSHTPLVGYLGLVVILYTIFFAVRKWLQSVYLPSSKNFIKTYLLSSIFEANEKAYQNYSTGKILSSVERLTDTSFIVIDHLIYHTIPDLLLILISTIFLLTINSRLGIVFLICNILLVFFVSRSFGNLLQYSKKSEGRYQYFDHQTADQVNNLEEIVARGQVPHEVEQLYQKSDDAKKAHTLFLRTSVFHGTMMSVYINLVTFGILIYTIKLYQGKNISTVLLVTIITILLNYRERMLFNMEIIEDYIEMVAKVSTVETDFQSFWRVLSKTRNQNKKTQNPASKNTYSKNVFHRDKGSLKVQNLYFTHPKSPKPTLQNINLDIPLNKSLIGIVGSSGSGKSTLMKLLTRLYPYSQGSISFQDTELNDIPHRTLRENVLYVNQNARLLEGDVLENLIYACRDKSCQEKLNKILANPKIRNYLPENLQGTQVGKFGENLSGGQRRIIGLINGLIKPSPILILDEPTNALDPKLKKMVIQMIQQTVSERKLTLIVTHDMELVPYFDRTIKIHDGHLI